MAAVGNTLALEELAHDSAAWRLIRARNGPWVVAVLNDHLGGTERKRPVNELVSLVEADIEELRFKTDIEFNLSAQAYCEQWRADGYLVRRPVPGTRQETYELSSDAAAAIRFVMGLLKPRRSATQSRLDTIVNRINKLATETDEDVEHRRRALLEERARIDEQLARLDEGELEPIDDVRALEQVQDIISLAQEIPEDFLHVRADFERISKQLHASIINSDAESESILRDVFAGVDRISQSPSGRSFNGFYTLLRNPELSEGTQDAIDDILDRGFTDELTADERRFLRNLLRDFLEQSQETNAMRTSFTHGLQRFVQNQSYQQERLLKQQLDRTLGMVHDLLDAHPASRRMAEPLQRSSVNIRPVSRLRLHNPADERTRPIEIVAADDAPEMTLEQLRAAVRETEIDFAELVGNVNALLASRRGSPPTVADVLAAHPATQGVASVVGLLSLACDQGRPRPGDETEIVRWTSKAGRLRRARIACYEFYEEVL